MQAVNSSDYSIAQASQVLSFYCLFLICVFSFDS